MTTPAETIAPELDQAVERIGDRFHGHEQSLRDRLVKPIHDAYQRGRMDALSELLTSGQVAAALGVTRQHITLLAKRDGVGWNIGRDILFRPEDIDMLRARKITPGREPA